MNNNQIEHRYRSWENRNVINSNHREKICDCYHVHIGIPVPCRPGKVYISFAGNGLYKIGFTQAKCKNNIKYRMRQIQKSNGLTLNPIIILKTNCARGLEAWLHCEFWNRHSHGEMFYLTDDDLKTICHLHVFNGGDVLIEKLQIGS
jgi:hypothetical protein